MNSDWYKDAVIYQIWPRSFCDGNGDGIGDLYGVYSKLDYIKSLGVDAIWFSPLYPSPNVDFGYDVSDYRAINPEYGDLEIFKGACSTGAHERGMRVIMDLVINHSFHGARVVPPRPRQERPASRLLLLARAAPGPQRRALRAEQLGQPLRRQRLGVRRAAGRVLPARLCKAAGRPQPRQPRPAPRNRGHNALLAGHGRGRLPRRRAVLYLQDAGPPRAVPAPARRRTG